MSGYWRDKASPVIEKVLRENEGKTIKEIRKELAKAYPFGQKKYWPYKVWLDEIRSQLGLKPPRPIKFGKLNINDPRQQKMFQEEEE